MNIIAIGLVIAFVAAAIIGHAMTWSTNIRVNHAGRFVRAAALICAAVVLVLGLVTPGGILYTSPAQAPATPATTTSAPETAAPAAPGPVYVNEADLCKDLPNPAWEGLIEKNSLTEKIYMAWLTEVTKSGGAVFGASKCSVAVDSHIFAPGDLINKSGPAQLVTDYRATSIWHPSVDASYKLGANCVFQPWFSQGDAPVGFWTTAGQSVRMANIVSNGVSLVGLVTCP